MLENPKSKSIGELQAEIEAALSRVATTPLPVGLEPLRYLAAPEGMAARVSLRYLAEHRQIRRTADGCYWNREDGECEAIVSYELEEAEHAPTERKAQPSSSTPQGLVSKSIARPCPCPGRCRTGTAFSGVCRHQAVPRSVPPLPRIRLDRRAPIAAQNAR